MKTLLESLKPLKTTLSNKNQFDTETGEQLKRIYDENKDKSYYDLFNLSHPLSKEAIDNLKKCYHQVSLIIHPDKVTEAYKDSVYNLFLLIKEAYEVLSDPSKEQAYFLRLDPVPCYAKNKEAQTARPSPSTVILKMNAYKNSLHHLFNDNTRISKGDINRGRFIQAHSRSISVSGNVYGDIDTVSGEIEISGDVYGNVKSLTGKIIIYGSVMTDASVQTVANDIYVYGKILGSVTSTFCRVFNNDLKYTSPPKPN